MRKRQISFGFRIHLFHIHFGAAERTSPDRGATLLVLEDENKQSDLIVLISEPEGQNGACGTAGSEEE